MQRVGVIACKGGRLRYDVARGAQGEKIDGDPAIKLQFVFSYPLLISFVPYFGGRFSRGGDGDFAC